MYERGGIVGFLRGGRMEWMEWTGRDGTGLDGVEGFGMVVVRVLV